MATIVMLPPQTATTRAWAARLKEAVPELSVVVAEDGEQAARELAGAEAAFGTLPASLLKQAARLRWLQAPQAAPPAGFYYPELIAHPAVVTNFREIYNDHIGAHIMAFVLAFARGLHVYLPQQLKREWRPEPRGNGRRDPPARGDRADRRRGRHRRRGGPALRGLRHARDRCGRAPARGAARRARSSTVPTRWTRCCRWPTSSSSRCRTRRPPRASCTARAFSA